MLRNVKEVVNEDVLGFIPAVDARLRYDSYTAYPIASVIHKLQQLESESLESLYICIYSDYETTTVCCQAVSLLSEEEQAEYDRKDRLNSAEKARKTRLQLYAKLKQEFGDV